MFCIACGTQNPDHAKFCMKCGAHAAEQAASTGGTFTPASSMKSNYPQAAPAASQTEPLNRCKDDLRVHFPYFFLPESFSQNTDRGE
jgi:ribosomal protein L40E